MAFTYYAIKPPNLELKLLLHLIILFSYFPSAILFSRYLQLLLVSPSGLEIVGFKCILKLYNTMHKILCEVCSVL